MTLEEMASLGWSLQTAADAWGITRSAMAGRARRAGVRFHADDPGGVRRPRANQYTLRKERMAKDAARLRESRKSQREDAARLRDEKRARLKAQFHKPGRIVALCGWMS